MKRKTLKNILSGFIAALFILAITISSLEYFTSYKTSKSIHQDAPVITRKSILIDAPVATVWKIFRDVDHWDNWQEEIVTPKINGPFQAGTSFNWKSNGLTITSNLQTVETNKTVAWCGPTFGSFAVHTWRFSEQNGQTTIRVEENMEGWLVTLLKGKFQSSLDKSIENWLKYLKIEAEKQSAHQRS
ncbi:putative membrane protein [Chryseobacterium ginsenosidimutans]|uniref:SRPBCC family protein n=1 Tax=Chryseobacterium ginsenosidimutans TaxID=687846 RepID=UPI002789BBE2|nr:SRPBCC family protein [Chryseobacterium ginsenosidimutans]MDQ0593651.1 putative membrane protein [Chryseobacterium ginsenosidimutans]